MRRFLKYALMVAALILACATLALATDGDPVVATVNGQPYTDLASALTASSVGDYVQVVSDASFSGTLTIPVGVRFKVPSGVTVSTTTGNINSYGFTDLSGQLIRTGSSTTGSVSSFLTVYDGVTNVYGQVISSDGYGRGIGLTNVASQDATVNIYGGTISALDYSVRASGGRVNVFGGSFYPGLIVGDHVFLANGSRIVDTNHVSWGGLYEIGEIVSESISWIGLFCAAIVANKLLLIFIIFVLGFVGLGLIKRMINN